MSKKLTSAALLIKMWLSGSLVHGDETAFGAGP